MEYRCTITIDVDSRSPKEAAKKAYEIMWSPDSMRPIVNVFRTKNRPHWRPYGSTAIDLSELPDGSFKQFKRGVSDLAIARGLIDRLHKALEGLCDPEQHIAEAKHFLERTQ